MLSQTLVDRIHVAIANQDDADELVTAINAAETLTPAADVAAVATANATDLTTAEALANQLKTTVNAILTNLKAAGLMS